MARQCPRVGNLVRRLVALYPQDPITIDLVDGELSEITARIQTLDDASTHSLSTIVENYLADHFAGFGKDLPPPGIYDRIVQDVERPLVAAALAATRGNQIRAAELLGLNRNTLRKKIRELGVEVIRTPSI